jgi:Spy/CpxP family protein refolding chaperone
MDTMRLFRRHLTATFLVTAALLGQGAPIIIPAPQPTYAQLKAYLNLTDVQLQTLENIYTNRMAAQQAIYQQISAKQTQLNQLLGNGTSDANSVGQLMIDIHNLQKQLPIPASTYRDQALKVLNPDQTGSCRHLSRRCSCNSLRSKALHLI